MYASDAMACIFDMQPEQFDATSAHYFKMALARLLGVTIPRVHIMSILPGSTVVVFQVLLPVTDPGAWVVPKLQRSEPEIQAEMEALGFTYPVLAYVPRVVIPNATGTDTTACSCGYSSLAFRLPGSDRDFGPPPGGAADATLAEPVIVSLGVTPAVLTVARRWTAAVNITQTDCCAFAMRVSVEWRLQAPSGAHILPSLTSAGAARVVSGSRLVVDPHALRAGARPYTVSVLVRHTATGRVLGMGLETFTVVDPPPQGAITVEPPTGQALDTEFTLRACEGWGDRTAIASYTFTAAASSLSEPMVVASGAPCSAAAQLPAGSPVSVTVCARDVHKGTTCQTAPVTVEASVFTAAQLDEKLRWLAELQGSAAQAGAAMLLAQAAASLRDPGERMRFKDSLMTKLRELDTCGGALRAAADVQACGALMQELTRDTASTSTYLRDSALSMTAELLGLGLGLGLLLADMDIETLTALFSGLLLANIADADFRGAAVRAVIDTAGLICGAAAREVGGAGGGSLYAVETEAFGVDCAAQDSAAVATTPVATGSSTRLLLGAGVAQALASAQAPAMAISAVQFHQRLLDPGSNTLATSSITLDPPLTPPFDPPITLTWAMSDPPAAPANGTPSCVWWQWDGFGGAWSTDGCRLTGASRHEVQCACTHLTEFSVVMPRPNVVSVGDLGAIAYHVAGHPGLLILQCALLALSGGLLLLGYVMDKRNRIKFVHCWYPPLVPELPHMLPRSAIGRLVHRHLLRRMTIDAEALSARAREDADAGPRGFLFLRRSQAKYLVKHHKYLGVLLKGVGTHYTTPQHVLSLTTMVFTAGLLVCLWFDVRDHQLALLASRKLILLCANLVLLLPLQLLLYLVFTKSECSWEIPGIAGLPFPDPPKWYQQLHETRCIAAPWALTPLQRSVLTDLHSLSHAAHDSADGLLALAHVLLAPEADDAGRPHFEAARRLSTVSLLSMRNLHALVSNTDRSASPDPERALSLPGPPEQLYPGDCGPSLSPRSASASTSDLDGDDGPARHRTLSWCSALSSLSSLTEGPERWATSARRRRQLLDSLADTCGAEHPWVAAFTKTLAEYERGHAPFETAAARERLAEGLARTLRGECGPDSVQGLWQLLLITIWSGEGHWALMLLRGALVRAHIDLELVFDLFQDCLAVAQAQVRATAKLLYEHLNYDPQEQNKRTRDLEETMSALHRGEGNVWVLPAQRPRGPSWLAREGGLRASSGQGLEEAAPGSRLPPRKPSSGSAESNCKLDDYKFPNVNGGLRDLDPPQWPAADCGSPCGVGAALRVQAGDVAEQPVALRPLDLPVHCPKVVPEVPPRADAKGAGSGWMWVKLDPSTAPLAPKPALSRSSSTNLLSRSHENAGPGVPKSSTLPDMDPVTSLSRPHADTGPGVPKSLTLPDMGPLSMDHGILDLTKCWSVAGTAGERASTPAPNAAPSPNAAAPPEARQATACTYNRTPRLLWPESQGAPYQSLSTRRQSMDACKLDSAAPLTSSLVKELLVTDFGISLPPSDGLGMCGVCVWDRGMAALGTRCVLLAGSCFAAGHAPVPSPLLRGIEPRGSAWPQFWCLYYAWALGHGAVLADLQALVKAQRFSATRGLGASVRLLPLAGGAATASTVGGLCMRRTWAFLPKPAPYRPGRAQNRGLTTFGGGCCAKHERYCADAVWLPGAADRGMKKAEDALGGKGPVEEVGARGGAGPPPAPAPPSPLSPIVNGLLGFPDTLFVGPTYDAAQRKTGSVFRPFHGVEEALRRVRPGQTVALLPGVYAPWKVLGLQATPAAPIRIVGLGRVVVTPPHKLRRGRRAALIKVRWCNNVAFAGLQLRTDGVGIDIGDNCYNIALHGLVTDAHKACVYPVPKYHNIRFKECLLHETRRSWPRRGLRALQCLQLHHRWVYLGYCFCALWIAMCVTLQLAMVSTISRTDGVDPKSVTTELMVLWLLTLLGDFFVVQPVVVVLLWLVDGRIFDPSWAMSQEVSLDWAAHLYSLA